MGFWPFGGAKRQRVVGSTDHGRDSVVSRTQNEPAIQREKIVEQPSGARRTSSQQQGDGDRTQRSSKSRAQNSKPMSYGPPGRSQTAPMPTNLATRRISRNDSQHDEKFMYRQNPLSQSSIGPENFTVMPGPPTLHAKRSDNDSHVPRRKSSKRKAEDFTREREIRAMTSSPIPIPKRPATLYDSGPLQRDNRHFHGPLNRKLERPTSEISLPLPGSLPNVLDMPNQNSFKVSLLAALSPRPNIRYDANLNNSSGKQSIQPNMAIRQAIAEDDVSDSKRINELADDLDSGGLRELMDRDRRRRERKREVEKAKLQRKLQRRAERQHEDEARRARTEAFIQASPSGIAQGLGLDTDSSPASKEASSRQFVDESAEDDPFRDPGDSAAQRQQVIRNPFEDERDMDAMHDQQKSEDEADITKASPVPVRSAQPRLDIQDNKPREKPSQSTLSPPVSPVHRAVDRSSLSQASFMNTPEILESTSLERRASDQSSQRLSTWTTFFKRGNRRKFERTGQGRKTPSEFSNTSRESFSRKQPPTMAPRTFRRSDSATPQRTLSRFREDLPEMPISPPDSRLQSPEATAPHLGDAVRIEPEREADPSSINTPSQRYSYGSQIAETLSRPSQSQQKPSVDLGPPSAAPVGMIISQSLASVDSEGSWLSGKPSKRQSGQLSHALKPSQSSLPRQTSETIEQEGVYGLSQEDYYGRAGPPNQTQSPQNIQSSENHGTDGEIIDKTSTLRRSKEVFEPVDTPTSSQKSDEQWHRGVEKQPKYVQRSGRAKSSEGLLDDSGEADVETGASSPGEGVEDVDSDSPDNEPKDTPLLRARSVEYKGHIRHISAGSAKLLDIKRSSIHSDHSRPYSAVTHKSDLTLHTEDAPSAPERS